MNNKKEKVRHAFSRSAETYDSHTDVQKELITVLKEFIRGGRPDNILEIGCATGNYTLQLAKEFSSAQIIALDFSQQMIEKAKIKLKGQHNVHFVCSDAEDFISAPRENFDLITSNATLHWLLDLDAFMKKISESLTDNGSFLCSIFGPETLCELRNALNFVYNSDITIPANSFPSYECLYDMASSQFADVNIQETFLTREYASLVELLRQMKNTGVTAGNTVLPAILTRDRLRAVDTWFLENYGGCAVTYQVFILSTQK